MITHMSESLTYDVETKKMSVDALAVHYYLYLLLGP